jgi:hypothetical protein
MKILLLTLTAILVYVFLVLCKYVRHSKIKIGAFSFLILGMLIGLLGGFQLFFWLDNTKGWNPYGWWFIATFISTVLGGLLGIFSFGVVIKKSKVNKLN